MKNSKKRIEDQVKSLKTKRETINAIMKTCKDEGLIKLPLAGCFFFKQQLKYFLIFKNSIDKISSSVTIQESVLLTENQKYFIDNIYKVNEELGLLIKDLKEFCVFYTDWNGKDSSIMTDEDTKDLFNLEHKE